MQRPALEEAVGLVEGREEPGVPRDVLGGAEEQVSGIVERMVERRDKLVLQFRRQVNQQVATGDQGRASRRVHRAADDVRREEQNSKIYGQILQAR